MGTAINAIKSHVLNRYFKGGTTSGSFNKMTAGFDALMLAGVPDSYAENRANGNGVISSALSSVGEFAVNMMLPMKVAIPLMLAPEIGALAADAYKEVQQYGRDTARIQLNRPFSNSTFVDTKQTYTMRQAGLNLARQSKYNVQQAMLGDEARMINL